MEDVDDQKREKEKQQKKKSCGTGNDDFPKSNIQVRRKRTVKKKKLTL